MVIGVIPPLALSVATRFVGTSAASVLQLKGNRYGFAWIDHPVGRHAAFIHKRRPVGDDGLSLEFELADARVPVETAGCRVVFVHMPEGHAVGRIDRCHAIIAPAAAGVGLAPRCR